MKRNASLDIARLIGAFGIVLFHAGAPGRSIGYAALPFFLMTLILLGLPAARTKSFGTFAAERAARLLIPWLIWSAVYAVFKLAEVVLHHKPLAEEFSATMLLTGTSLHLWFLPFAFAACLMLPTLTRLWPDTAPPPPPSQVWGPALLLALALASMVLQQSPGLPVPLAQWSFGLPAILIGAALGFSLKSRALTLLTSAGIVLGGVIAWGLGWTAGLLQLGLGAAVLLACLMWPSPETAVTRFCARASMTVYLVHPLILSILERLTHLSRGGLALALLTMAVSFAYAVLQDYLMGLKSKPTVMP